MEWIIVMQFFRAWIFQKRPLGNEKMKYHWIQMSVYVRCETRQASDVYLITTLPQMIPTLVCPVLIADQTVAWNPNRRCCTSYPCHHQCSRRLGILARDSDSFFRCLRYLRIFADFVNFSPIWAKLLCVSEPWIIVHSTGARRGI